MSDKQDGGAYQFTTVDYTNRIPHFRSEKYVELFLQIGDEELVAGSCIDVSSDEWTLHSPFRIVDGGQRATGVSQTGENDG